MTSSQSGFNVGQVVRYTWAGFRAMQPPSADVTGTVVEVENPHSILVQWPMGLGYEMPEHIKVVG